MALQQATAHSTCVRHMCTRIHAHVYSRVQQSRFIVQCSTNSFKLEHMPKRCFVDGWQRSGGRSASRCHAGCSQYTSSRSLVSTTIRRDMCHSAALLMANSSSTSASRSYLIVAEAPSSESPLGCRIDRCALHGLQASDGPYVDDQPILQHAISSSCGHSMHQQQHGQVAHIRA